MTKHKVGQLRDFNPNTAHHVVVDGEDVVLVRNGDDVYALEDRCSHTEVALSDGDVNGCEIECFLHGATFDVRTGEATGLPATAPVKTFPVTIEDPDGTASVYVEIG